MKEYFTITYKEKSNIVKEMKIEARYLIINIIKLQKEDCMILNLEDNFGDFQDSKEMIEIYKESVDIEYEDIETKEEAYELANNYFKELYDKAQINKEEYNNYIYKLEKLKASKSSTNKFIENVKKLYIE